ncbi:MAG TPA: biotin--[acetyl-CoA-carboxylase] ligase, partial [Azospira sp.]|nr:biotin--[acetyl-CoA-carboxylase] ligase [Azospira sp.]
MAAPLIDPILLLPRLGPVTGRVDVDSVASCDSSSSELSRRAAQGAPAGSVLVADRQTAGRGRRGRTWVSSLGGSLTFSLLWRFDRGAGHLGGLSLAVGLSVARSLAACGVDRARV